MRARRAPRGYLGIDHEITGLSLVALQQVLKPRDSAHELVASPRLGPIDPQQWYPIDVLLELMDRLDEYVGYFGLVRMGRTVFDLSHRATASRWLHSARDVLYGLDAMYHQTNRGRGIGGWEVLRFQPGCAEIEKTTPQHCAMDQGILSAALASAGCAAMVNQSACLLEGAEACRFVISSAVTDARWGGKR